MSAMAMQPPPKGGVGERARKPRPLELEGRGEGGGSPEPLPTDALLDLMMNIQGAVKTGSLDPHLASLIFKLYYQLKLQGHQLEQTNKNEMNRVFVSLRQACCRDAGQLGTPCRLKIMELVELRAMGWRPNLAHSQYYLHRQPTPLNGSSTTNLHHQGHQGHPGNGMGEMESGPGPVSAPPFGTVPMNPFAFAMPPPPPVSAHPIISQHQPHFQSLADMSNMMSMSANGRPSYYLVPAAGPSALFHHFQPPSPLPPPQLQPLGPHHFIHQQPIQHPPQQLSPGRDPATPSDWPKGALIKASPKFTAPQRVPGKNQFRDEILIRNADSGKIMGVKGRRVAVVEGLTKTVISFQKVASGAKERTLTLTANTEEEIAYAKKLIEETIRRNVSPNRGPDDPGDGWVGEGLMETSGTGSLMEGSMEGSFSSLLEGIRLQCDDPEMLAAAQEALADYFQRGGVMRRSQGSVTRVDRDAKRERRKSMPSFSPEAGVVVKRADGDHDWRRGALPFLPPEPKDPARATTESPKTQGVGVGLSAGAKSTPDLSEGGVGSGSGSGGRGAPAGGGVGRLGMRVVYTKDYLLKCAGSPLATCSPGNMPHIAKEAPEILREIVGRYSAEEYKLKVAALKNFMAVQI